MVLRCDVFSKFIIACQVCDMLSIERYLPVMYLYYTCTVPVLYPFLPVSIVIFVCRVSIVRGQLIRTAFVAIETEIHQIRAA
jgi:hypothetical protein